MTACGGKGGVSAVGEGYRGVTVTVGPVLIARI